MTIGIDLINGEIVRTVTQLHSWFNTGGVAGSSGTEEIATGIDNLAIKSLYHRCDHGFNPTGIVAGPPKLELMQPHGRPMFPSGNLKVG